MSEQDERVWSNEDVQIRKNQLPVIDYKVDLVLISILMHERVEVQGFDGYGRLAENFCSWREEQN
jgi:hypothetical protein